MPGSGSRASRVRRPRVAAQDGALVDWVQATKSAAAVPLGAFAGVVPDGVRSSDALALMRRSVESLASGRTGARSCIGVDDAQLLDPVSAALVLHLTVTGSAFIIATVRTGEPCPDAIVSLWKDAGALRMQLDPLDDAAVEELVETALGGPVEQGGAALDPGEQPGQRALRPRARARRPRLGSARLRPRSVAAVEPAAR